MKKIILGLSGLLALSLIVVLFINAQTSTQDVKKPATETSMNCGACPSASAAAAPCAAKVENITAEAKTCDPAKCKEMGCDPAKCKEGKCDPATCKAHVTAAAEGVKACCPAMAKK